MPDDETPKPRGLAAMDPERRREIASKGGKATQAKGTGNRFTTETAREAGIKGGRPSHKLFEEPS